MKPTIRPGAALLRRDARHLQVGTNPGVVIRDHPGLYPLLLSLDGIRDLEALRRNARRRIPTLTVDVADALAPLVESGAVVDAQVTARPAVRVEIAQDGHSAALARGIAGLLGDLGIAVGSDGDLLIVASSGEPSRTLLGDLVRCGIAHLVVVEDADAVRVGPLVLPGRTPCVQCADLHRAHWDPGWTALTPQFGRSVPSGASSLTRHTAMAEVAAACLEFAEAPHGRDVVDVGPDRTVRVVATPAFHPRCSCALLEAG